MEGRSNAYRFLVIKSVKGDNLVEGERNEIGKETEKCRRRWCSWVSDAHAEDSLWAP
jgi:hypothetical protein